MNAAQECFPGWEGMLSSGGSSRPAGADQPGELEDLILHGLPDGEGRRIARPARHFSSILNQIAFSRCKRLDSFDSLLAPFVREDGLSFKEVKQALQGLAFALLYRSQEKELPCLKIRLDLICPERLRDRKAMVAGKELPYTYEALSNEADEICRALKELLNEGNAEGEPFTCLSIANGSQAADWEEDLPQGISYELFTMKSCKKCAAVRDFMSLTHLEGRETGVDSDRGFDRASEAGVFVTPTVIFYSRDKEEIARAHNVQELESVLILLKDHR